MESRINDLERSVKKEVKGVVKEDDLENAKDELLEKINDKLDSLLADFIKAKN